MNEENSTNQEILSPVQDNTQIISTAPPKKDEVESTAITDSSISNFQIIMLIIYLLLILIVVLIVAFVPSVKEYFYGMMADIQSDMSVKTGVYLVLLGFCLTLIGFPLSLYELALGYMIENFLIALAMDFTFKFTGVFCLFIFSKYFFKKKLEIIFQNSIIFKTIQKGIEKNPWKALIMIKLLVIPHIFKNLGLGITEIKIHQFLIVNTFNCLLFGSIWLYFGSEMKNLNEVFHSNERPISFYVLKYSLIAITGVILILMLVSAKIYFEEVKQEVSREKLQTESDQNKRDEEKDDKLKNYGTLE